MALGIPLFFGSVTDQGEPQGKVCSSKRQILAIMVLIIVRWTSTLQYMYLCLSVSHHEVITLVIVLMVKGYQVILTAYI